MCLCVDPEAQAHRHQLSKRTPKRYAESRGISTKDRVRWALGRLVRPGLKFRMYRVEVSEVCVFNTRIWGRLSPSKGIGMKVVVYVVVAEDTGYARVRSCSGGGLLGAWVLLFLGYLDLDTGRSEANSIPVTSSTRHHQSGTKFLPRIPARL